MDSQIIRKSPINPRKNANILSKITFWHTRGFFTKGFKKELEEEDLYEVLPELDTCRLGDQIESEYKSAKKLTIFWVLWNMFGKFYILVGLINVVTIISQVARPTLMSKLVFYFTINQEEVTKKNAYLYAAILIGLHITDIIVKQNFIYFAENLALKVRTAICSLIYRKILKLPAHRRYVSFGELTNIMTRDIYAFRMFFMTFNFAWICLVSSVIIIVNMYRRVGLAATVAAVSVVLCIPLQVCFGLWTKSLKRATCEKTDKRIELLHETLLGIRSTKMYVWEQHLKNNITEARRKEMSILLKMMNVTFMNVASAMINYNLAFYLALMTYIWLGQPLSAETMYYFTGAFMALSYSVVTIIPVVTLQSSQLAAAIRRIQNLLKTLEPEGETFDIIETKLPRIILKDVTVKTKEKIVLDHVNIHLERGLTIITGDASSGKTILLMTILKEFRVLKGCLSTEGTISYASQEPWLFPSTIRQNIIFGSKYNEQRYRQVIEACSLQYDFDILEKGDLTIIADRGINLSKGQQSRINLARAIYKESDIYLLDDCLSCLDSLVVQSVFTNCIIRFLKNKLVLLITNNPKLKHHAENVLNIHNGFVELWMNNLQPQPETIFEEKHLQKINYHHHHHHQVESETEDNTNLKTKLLKADKIYGEEKQCGAVKLRIFKTYLRLGGGVFYFLIICGIFLSNQIILSYKDKLISEWANSANSHSNETTVNDNKYVYGYTAAVIGLSLTTFFRAIALFHFANKVSVNLHKKMLHSILGAPLKFFDQTFIGNIANRFSKDLASVDENIPFSILHIIAVVFECFGNLLLIASTNTTLLIQTVLVFTSYIILRYFYVGVGRSLKRLDATTKSPVIGYLKATLEGLVTIKVFQAEKLLKKEFERHHNLYNSASHSYLSCTKAFILAIDLCVAIFIAAVILQFIIFDQGVQPGDVGLAISQAFLLGNVFFFWVQHTAELETEMTSVERAVEYIDISQEKTQGLVISKWPRLGEIKYKNVYLSVSKSYLLKNINFCIKPMEKIGIVGRTGAGKSSIISALFQLYETEGEIVIDGIDIKTLSLDFLRSSISIIPQDPILFNGTVRQNIDPEGRLSDDIIWSALDTVNLKKLIFDLDINIKKCDFTCGQRQLICLARVLVQNNKILVLDEMTENVDSQTEKLINEIVEEKFASCTVIKIAHKLNFILNSDKVLVLNQGEIVEYDSPSVLLQNRDGLFYKMFQMYKLN